MRLAFLLSSLRLSGGVRVIIEYANRLSERGYQITLVTPGGTVEPDVIAELRPSVAIRESQVEWLSAMNPVQLLKLTWSLAEAVPFVDVIVSTHTPTTVASFIASKIKHKGRLIWLYQDYLAMFQGRRLEAWLLRHALRWHDAAFAVSSFAQQELAQFAPGCIFVVGEGLSQAEIFQPVPFVERAFDGNYWVLTMGDMRQRKGFFDFLQAIDLVYAQIPNLKLLIFAKEPCQIETRVPFIYFYRPERHVLAELYAKCHLFVSASHWESFGLPPLEAMACGTPVVMTNAAGVTEYAIDGENCLLTPPADPAALAVAIQQVLQNRTLAQYLSENGPKTAQKFSWEKAVERFETALRATIT